MPTEDTILQHPDRLDFGSEQLDGVCSLIVLRYCVYSIVADGG